MSIKSEKKSTANVGDNGTQNRTRIEDSCTNTINNSRYAGISAHADGTRATMPLMPNRPSRCIQQCTPCVGNRRRLYTARAMHICCQAQPVAVYIALADGRRAVAIFSKSWVWDKVPLFLEIPHFAENIQRITGLRKSKNQLDPSSVQPSRYNSGVWKTKTDRHMDRKKERHKDNS